MPLTNLQIQNAKPKEKAYRLADSGGLYLEITPAGGKIWRYKYRHLGKEKKLTIGPYPEISLADARERHFAARKQVVDGIDPSAKKQEKKEQSILEADTTFEKVAALWYERKRHGVSERYAGFMWSRLEKDILATLGSKPITSITSLQLIGALKAVEARGAHELARRLKQSCDEVFRYAVVHGYAPSNPCKEFESRDVLSKYKKNHFAAIEPGEIPDFLQALHTNKGRLYRLTQLAVELLMLTFVRTSELIEAEWSEIDWDDKVWRIPAHRMKMGRPHLVPLSKQALAILTELKDMTGHRQFIFPGQVDPRKTMSNNTILQALKSMGYQHKMTGHGFRSLAMTTIKERIGGYEHEVIDTQLAHAKENKIRAAYDRAQFLPERTKMMQDWADYLDGQRKS